MQEAQNIADRLEAAIRELQERTEENNQSKAAALADKIRGAEDVEPFLWDVLVLFKGDTFKTAKGLTFTYSIRGNEMFVSRKDKSITRSTVTLAFRKAVEIQETGAIVKGPKKLGCFGASYLYPIFIHIGVIDLGETEQEEETTGRK